MKKTILFLAMLVTAISASQAQTKVKQVGNQFVIVKDSAQHTETAIVTTYTFKTTDGEVLPVYKSKTGKFFVYRKSKKTGTEYKQYLITN